MTFGLPTPLICTMFGWLTCWSAWAGTSDGPSDWADITEATWRDGRGGYFRLDMDPAGSIRARTVSWRSEIYLSYFHCLAGYVERELWIDKLFSPVHLGKSLGTFHKNSLSQSTNHHQHHVRLKQRRNSFPGPFSGWRQAQQSHTCRILCYNFPLAQTPTSESSKVHKHTQLYIQRKQEERWWCLQKHYFSTDPVYPHHQFRQCFRMSRRLFPCITKSVDQKG